MPLLETIGSSGARGFGLNSFASRIVAATNVTFNSFGLVDPQYKATTYTTYSGGSPTGTKSTQYTRMTCGATSGRPGGLAYTDILLNDDFFICFYTSHGADFYSAWWFYDENYATWTHEGLGGNNYQDYGWNARYGCYLTPTTGADIWDGLNQPEGSGGNYGYNAATASLGGTGYIGFRRDTNGKFYTYYSTSAPGAGGYSNMTLIHGPSTTTYTGRVRLGMFQHDSNDYAEVYSTGTSIKQYSNFISDHSPSNWTMATSSSGNRSFTSGNYFAGETSSNYKYAMSSVNLRPESFFAAGPIAQNSYYRVNGNSPSADSFEFYFAGKEATPTNFTFYTYPATDYVLGNAAWQRWNGSGWTTVAGVGDYSNSSGWTTFIPGYFTGSYLTGGIPRNPVSFTFTGTQAEAYEYRSKFWRLWIPASSTTMSGTDDVWHSNGVGPINFWTWA